MEIDSQRRADDAAAGSTPAPAVFAQGMPRADLEDAIRKTAFAVWIGAKLEDYRAGQVTLSVPMKPEITMHHGFAHGAVISFLADSACAWAAASIAGDVVTSEYKLNFLAPGIGDSLKATGTVIKASSRQIVCRADVFGQRAGKEQIIATALATIAKFK